MRSAGRQLACLPGVVLLGLLSRYFRPDLPVLVELSELERRAGRL